MNECSESRSRWLVCGSIVGTLFLIMAALTALLYYNNRPPQINIPRHGVPKSNGWDDFVRAGEMVNSINHLGPYSQTRPMNSWTIPEYESFVRDNTPAFKILRCGLNKPYMHPCWRSFSDRDFPSYARIREMARTLSGEALYYKTINKPIKAADSFLDGVELGVTLPRGGGLITDLVGVAVEMICTKDFPGVIDKLDSEELNHVASRLVRIQKKRWPYSEVVLEDGRMSTEEWKEIFTKSSDRKQIMNPGYWQQDTFCLSSKSNPSLADRAGFVCTNARFAFANKTAILIAIQDYHEAAAREQQHPYKKTSRVCVPNTPILEICNSNLTTARCARSKAETKLTLIQTYVALRRYKLNYGCYPTRLSQLMPGYLKKIPIDPFGLGKPLHYKLLKGGQGYLLYSVGFDQKDNGGSSGDWYRQDVKGDLLLK
ncbi:MAG: hypothetical protein ABFD54_06245 [Armatimonadota bacterium]|nr:hypothetical protein [bacterium]